jgi:hypothetical protein
MKLKTRSSGRLISSALKIISCLFFIFNTFNSFSQCGPPASAHCQGIPFSEMIRSTSGNLDFTFDNFSKYNGGVTFSGATLLRLKVLANDASCKWVLKMYIDNNGGATPINEWETSFPYSTSGLKPTLDLIQVKVYNGCNTPINSGIYQNFMPTTGASIDIINDVALNVAGSCVTNVNGAGSYLTNYNEYSFTVDYRIVPGLTYAAGIYTLNIHFCLVEE